MRTVTRSATNCCDAGLAAIVDSLRKTDLVARGRRRARIGTPKIDIEGARDAIEKALDAVRALEVPADNALRVTFPLGIAIGRRSRYELVARADIALYEAKRAGRDPVHVG